MQGIEILEWLADAEDSPAWRERSAGLVVLRLAKAALQRLSGYEEVPAVRALASRVPVMALQQRMLAVVAHITPSLNHDDQQRYLLCKALYTLGVTLHDDGHLKAAVDVFEVLKDHVKDVDLRLLSLQRLGYAWRVLKQFEESEMAYDLMYGVAVMAKNPRMRLEAQLGHGYVCIDRGNMPAASPHVSRVLASARRRGWRDLVGKALFARAAISGIRRDHVQAIVDSFEAIDYVGDEVNRQRLTYTIAIAFREVGHAAAAIRIADHLAAHATEADLRALASIHRYNLAIDAGDEFGMERARRSLGAIEKSPQPTAEYFEAVARDYAKRGRLGDARNAAEQMREIAEEFGMNEILFRAEDALSQIEKGLVPTVYDWRPVETTTAAEQRLAAVEERLGELCAAEA